MYTFKFFIWFFLFFVTNKFVAAQCGITNTIVYGKVLDARTGQELPLADLYFKNSQQGVTSDINGKYRLNSSVEVDSIVIRYLGYAEATYPVVCGSEQEINIELNELGISLGTATVRAKRKKIVKDTAAIALWRQVKNNRSKNSIDNLSSYKYTDYTQTGFDWFNPNKNIIGLKFLLKPLSVIDDYVAKDKTGTPFLPMMIRETITEVRYQKNPLKKKINIIADKMSGMDNESLTDFIGTELDEMNFYKDLIILTGKSFISPFASTANLTYKYFLTDSSVIENEKYYELTFVGKRKQDFTFMGVAWIHKASYGIASINYEISPHIALNFIKELEGSHTYKQTAEKVWLKEKEIMNAKVAFAFFDFGSRKNRQRKNQIRIRKKLWRYNTSLNPVFEPEVLTQENMMYNERSNELTMNEWDSIRPLGLDSLGYGTYEMIDSIRRTRFYKNMDHLLYSLITSHIRAGKVEFGSYSEFFSWNQIEGYRFKLGMRTTKKFSKKYQFSIYSAYGIKDQSWKYGSELKWLMPSKNRKWNLLHFSWFSDYRMLSQDNRAVQHDDFMNVISRSMPMDRLMKMDEGFVSWQKDWFMGFYTKLSYKWTRFYSVNEGFVFSKNQGETILPHLTTSEFIFKVHWGHEERFWVDNSGFKRYSLNSEYPILDLTYTAGIKGLLHSEHNYHKIDFSMRHRLNSPIGYTKYQVHASKSFGSVPYPAMSVLLGNESIMRNAFAFNLMNEFEFVSDMYATIWITHHFDGLIFNSIPLIKKLKLRSLFIFKGLYGTVEQKNLSLYDFPEGVSAPGLYAEIGFGIENILKILRVDFLWRLTHLNQPDIRSFGINISFAPKF
ncbi:MAG: DUF5686 and carboxypeptidase regulatory-like domain-containing protein [Saprospiraceae bacterium]|nr:DUF5686 and carboxypeptidase regulatory-like domain-containing protein [Saprospiraceae bacterium]